MPVLRRVFLPERPRLLPALLAGAVAVALNVLWFITGSAWFAIVGWPFVWICFSHVGLRLDAQKRTMLLVLLVGMPVGCGDDDVPETMEQCFEDARQEYWRCHTAWFTGEQGCLSNFRDDQSTCEFLFPFPVPPTKR